MNAILSVPFTVGLRYARGRKRNRFGSVVAAFSVFGMALGVAALIIVLSVMNGFNREIKERFQLVSPHLTLTPSSLSSTEQLPLSQKDVFAFLQANDLVSASSPQLESFALVARSGVQVPVTLKGIEPVADSAVVPLSSATLYGSLDELIPGEFGIVLGAYIARQLLVMPGDQIYICYHRFRLPLPGFTPGKNIFGSWQYLIRDHNWIRILPIYTLKTPTGCFVRVRQTSVTA